jgi:hypothetical protein
LKLLLKYTTEEGGLGRSFVPKSIFPEAATDMLLKRVSMELKNLRSQIERDV